jgi:hypothetical protein
MCCDARQLTNQTRSVCFIIMVKNKIKWLLIRLGLMVLMGWVLHWSYLDWLLID